MSEIKFHLTVHTPWRAVEGLIIDIKARFAANDPTIVDSLRSELSQHFRVPFELTILVIKFLACLAMAVKLLQLIACNIVHRFK
jgi:hypothetical protein